MFGKVSPATHSYIGLDSQLSLSLPPFHLAWWSDVGLSMLWMQSNLGAFIQGCGSQSLASLELISNATLFVSFVAVCSRWVDWFQRPVAHKWTCLSAMADEALHCDFACTCTLYHCRLKPPCSIHVWEIVNSAIQIEEHFIREALLSNLMGVNVHSSWVNTFDSVPIASYMSSNNLLSTTSPILFHGWIWSPSKAKQTSLRNK
jgi:hypothetical protein